MVPKKIKYFELFPLGKNGKIDIDPIRATMNKVRLTNLHFCSDDSNNEINDWLLQLCHEKISGDINSLKQKWSEITNIDSLSYIEMIVLIEEKYSFEFPNEYLSRMKLDSIKQIIDVLHEFKINEIK